jgi:hypothetical protein
MDLKKNEIELLDFGFKTKKSSDKYSSEVGEITFGGEINKTATMKLNLWAIKPDALNLKMTAEEKKSKKKQYVSIAPGKNGKVVIFNPTELGAIIPKEHLLTVTPIAHSVKLSTACVKSIYESNDLLVGEKLEFAKNWSFSLNRGTANVGGKAINVFTIIKLEEMPEKKSKVKATRTEKQLLMTKRINDWRAANTKNGKKASVAEFWTTFYTWNPTLKSWIDAENLEGKKPTIKKFIAAYPKTEILWEEKKVA